MRSITSCGLAVSVLVVLTLSPAVPGNAQSRVAASTSSRLGSGRQAIFRKLESIRFSTITFDNMALAEVVESLVRKTRALDPEGRGINFIIIPGVKSITSRAAQSGLPPANLSTVVPAVSSEAGADVNAVRINLVAPLEDIRLVDVLELITQIAPLRYSVEDYGVAFRLKTRDDVLQVRTYKVDPNTFMQGLESVTAFPFGSVGAGTGQGGGILTVPRVSVAPTASTGTAGVDATVSGGISGVTRPALRSAAAGSVVAYFNRLGLDLAPPKSVVFDDRSGTLVVRATRQDLETINTALQSSGSSHKVK